MLKYHIQTFGCQMNYSDTERVTAILEKSGYQKGRMLEDVDLFIFNTCSIKQKGEDRVYGMIKNIASFKKANPHLLIGITGCMVRQTSSRNSPPEKKDHLLQQLGPLDFVFKITDTHKLPDVLIEAQPSLDLRSIDEVALNDYLRVTPEYTSKFQATVPIQIGCDKYCTYCIVPYSRGREQSRPMEDILAECRQLVENGCKEITLVGQTVNSYGLSSFDKQSGRFEDYHLAASGKPLTPFVKLLGEINTLSELGLSRLRYSSPHPRDFSDELIEAHATFKTLCPYLHLPIQSGDNQILARMNRKYSVEQYREKIQKLLAEVPDCVITTDIIVGFCGETDQQFENTYKLFEEIRWDQAFISRYSERQGTLAEKAFPDDVTAEIKSSRWHKLNNLLKKISKEKNQAYVGRTLEVLVERYNPLTKEYEGRSREMKLVQFSGAADVAPNLVGKILQIEILKGLDWLLKGKQSL
jgi:tRNA-2-methylthio-N6-dimethylallyladenosine synthase